MVRSFCRGDWSRDKDWSVISGTMGWSVMGGTGSWPRLLNNRWLLFCLKSTYIETGKVDMGVGVASVVLSSL